MSADEGSMERWLEPNRRALMVGGVASGLGGILVGAIAIWLISSAGLPARLIGWLLAVVAVGCFAVVGGFLYALRQPRVGFSADHLCILLTHGAHFRIPLHVVECFFLGQGPTTMGTEAVADADARNVVVRLAEREKDWHQRDVRPALGNWCGGYITIRGAWCERIDGEVVNQMNSRLAAVKRDRRAQRDRRAETLT